MPVLLRSLLSIAVILILSPCGLSQESSTSYQSIKPGKLEGSSIWKIEGGGANTPGCAISSDVSVMVKDSLVSSCAPLMVNGSADFGIQDGGHLEITKNVDVFGDATFRVDKNSTITINGDLAVSGNADFNLDGKLIINGDISINGNGSACGAGRALVTGNIAGEGWCLNLGVLPIDAVSFKAKLQEDEKVSLKWETKEEFESDAFILERSRDGMIYEEVAKIAGAGTSSESNKYSYIDEQLRDGTYYYRLSQVKLNGDRDYYEPVSASIIDKKREACELEVHPNPCIPSCMAYLDCPGSVFKTSIIDGYGQTITELIPISEFDGQATYHINKDNFMMPGVYVLKAESSERKLVKKVMIK